MPRSFLRIISVLTLLLVLAIAASQQAAAQDQGDTPKVHVVQPGETLSDIARAYGITADALIGANNLASSVDILVGQRLVIPSREPIGVAATTILGVSDSLETIAVKHGTEFALIAALNRAVNPLQIYAGQAISIPEASMVRPAAVDVVRSDAQNSIWRLALRRNMNANALTRMNGIQDPLLIAPGTLLAVSANDETESTLPVPWGQMTIHPLPIEVGRSGVLYVETTQPGTVSATFLGLEIPMIVYEGGLVGFLSVHRWTEPGLYPLNIAFAGSDGTTANFSRLVRVNPGGYAAEIIKLSEDDAETFSDSASVQEEADYIAGLMSGFTPDRMWNGLMKLPATGVMSSAFGTARSYDLGATYDVFHAGTDFFAEQGTPIFAPADGIVVQTAYLDVRGNFTIIDHGWGVYSGFWHQSEVLVAVGDRVTTGQNIGKIGSTGLSTAAHLHWELWVNGIQVDPLQWAREEFP
jgi:murein DD-endopeptidase MepM/ murein hydrolase activator NlpD